MRTSYRLLDVETSDGATVRIELTAAASKLLRDLEARDYLREARGPCHLVTMRVPGDRWALVVPVDYGGPERLRGVNGAAVTELRDRGLILLDASPLTPPPAYGYRDPKDGAASVTVELTDLGRQRLRRYRAAAAVTDGRHTCATTEDAEALRQARRRHDQLVAITRANPRPRP